MNKVEYSFPPIERDETLANAEKATERGREVGILEYDGELFGCYRIGVDPSKPRYPEGNSVRLPTVTVGRSESRWLLRTTYIATGEKTNCLCETTYLIGPEGMTKDTEIKMAPYFGNEKPRPMTERNAQLAVGEEAEVRDMLKAAAKGRIPIDAAPPIRARRRPMFLDRLHRRPHLRRVK